MSERKSKAAAKPLAIRDRIKEFRRVRAGDLVPNEKNWRTHPQGQRDALQGILTDIGVADALIARPLPDGRLGLLDGHLRQDLDPEQLWPVLVLDLDEAEADKLILSLDPLAAMAEADSDKLSGLLKECETADAGLKAMLDGLAEANGIGVGGVELKPISTLPPPKMAWVLLGLPVVRFAEIAAQVEALAAVEGIVLETTQNDGDTD
jgi:hypothetical protein